MSDCPFCLRESLEQRLILETKNLIIVSDAYPITRGHLLILSKKHLLSFGHASVEERSEVVELVRRIAESFSGLGCCLVFFEHGNMQENVSGKPSVDHAHIHIIPTNKRVETLFPANRMDMNFMNLDNVVKKMAYYFFWDVFSGISFSGQDFEIESQFIRRILSSKSNGWNWRMERYQQDTVRKNAGFIRRLLE